jgi:hypothetical protein
LMRQGEASTSLSDGTQRFTDKCLRRLCVMDTVWMKGESGRSSCRSKDGTLLAVSRGWMVRVYDCNGFQELARHELPGRIKHMFFSARPDIFFSVFDCAPHVLDMETNTLRPCSADEFEHWRAIETPFIPAVPLHETVSSPTPTQPSCKICFGDFDKSDLVTICRNPKCQGQYCRDCLSRSFTDLVSRSFASCPAVLCLQRCSFRISTCKWQAYVSSEVVDKYATNANHLLTMRCGDCDTPKSLLPAFDRHLPLFETHAKSKVTPQRPAWNCPACTFLTPASRTRC